MNNHNLTYNLLCDSNHRVMNSYSVGNRASERCSGWVMMKVGMAILYAVQVGIIDWLSDILYSYRSMDRGIWSC